MAGFGIGSDVLLLTLCWRDVLRDILGLALRPIPVASLHDQPLLPGRQLDGAKLGNSHRFIRHITKAVLGTQLLLQDLENPIQGLLLRNFE